MFSIVFSDMHTIFKCHMLYFSAPARLGLSIKKTRTSYSSGYVEPNMTLQAPGIAVNNLEQSEEISIPIYFLENWYC